MDIFILKSPTYAVSANFRIICISNLTGCIKPLFRTIRKYEYHRNCVKVLSFLCDGNSRINIGNLLFTTSIGRYCVPADISPGHVILVSLSTASWFYNLVNQCRACASSCLWQHLSRNDQCRISLCQKFLIELAPVTDTHINLNLCSCLAAFTNNTLFRRCTYLELVFGSLFSTKRRI